MARLRPWIVPVVLAAVAIVLLTRIPLIAVIAGEEDRPVPASCTASEGELRAALARAPRPVRLADGSPLSHCFSNTSGSGEVQEVGQRFVEVASDLGTAARARPNRRAATQLGYMLGAMRRSTAASRGVYANVLQRVEQEAVGVEPERALRAGERAGRATG